MEAWKLKMDHHFEELDLDLNLEPHLSEKLDPDPDQHSSEKLDPVSDLH
jgi:hypothetical protein